MDCPKSCFDEALLWSEWHVMARDPTFCDCTGQDLADQRDRPSGQAITADAWKIGGWWPRNWVQICGSLCKFRISTTSILIILSDPATLLTSETLPNVDPKNRRPEITRWFDNYNPSRSQHMAVDQRKELMTISSVVTSCGWTPSRTPDDHRVIMSLNLQEISVESCQFMKESNN